MEDEDPDYDPHGHYRDYDEAYYDDENEENCQKLRLENFNFFGKKSRSAAFNM